MEWMLLPYKRYFDFSGRSRRKEYWMFVLLNIIVAVIASALIFSQVPMSEAAALAYQSEGPGTMFYLGLGLLLVFAIFTFIPSLAVQIRRFHDQDKSGWFILLGLIPYIGGIVVLVFMCMEGTRGPNRFGVDPKDPTSSEVFA